MMQPNFKKVLGLTLVLATLFAPLLSWAQMAEGSLPTSRVLLNAYGFRCPQVVTRDVGTSLGQIYLLNSVLEELRKSNQCLNVNIVSGVHNRYQGIFEDHFVANGVEQQKFVLEKKIALYSAWLLDPSLEATQQDYLKQEIFTAQADLLEVNASIGRFNKFVSKQSRVANEYINAVDDFLSSQVSNPQCFKNKQVLFSSLVSNSLLLTAAFASPGTALALAAAGVVTQSVGQFVVDYRFLSAEKRIEDVEMPTALRCVSQVLSDQYCETAESKKLLNEQGTREVVQKFESLDVLKNDLGPLAHWLEEVYAGSEIASEGDLVNREKPILQAELLNKIMRYIETYGTIRRKDFENINDSRQRSEAIALGIQNLVTIMRTPNLNPAQSGMYSTNSGAPENPIFSSRSEALLVFQLFDPSITMIPKCGFNDCSLVEDLRNRGVLIDLDRWSQAIANARRVVQTTLDQVNVARARAISVDAYTILVNATRDLKGETSPYEGLLRISDMSSKVARYLEETGCKRNSNNCKGPGNIYYPQISNTLKTKVLTESVIALVIEASNPRDLPDDALPLDCKLSMAIKIMAATPTDLELLENKSFRITSCITKLLKLEERGVDVYFTKIKSIVSYEMEARLRNQELSREIDDIVADTRADLVTAMLSTFDNRDSGSRISREQLNIGFDTAMNNMQRTYTEFFKFFSSDLEKAFSKNQMSDSERVDLCFRILPFVVDASSGLQNQIEKACMSAQMGAYKDGPVIKWSDYYLSKGRSVLNLNKGLAVNRGKSLEDRFCDYRRYHRKNALIELWKNRRNKR